jgi:PIN domain nuclease of toxin-antitoxin system
VAGVALTLLLDTHAWIWWVQGSPELPKSLRVVVDQAASEQNLLVSSFNVWEFAVLVRKGRLKLTVDARSWLELAMQFHGVQFIDVSPSIAFESQQLEWTHQDPADRLIVATALEWKATLVTKDTIIQDFFGAQSLWK